MSPRIPLSVVTITKNSSARIEKNIENSLQLAGEVVVVDTGSSDTTSQLAERAGARVVHFEGEFDYSAARNLGTKSSSGDWVLHKDDDEFIDPIFKPRLEETISSDKSSGSSLGGSSGRYGCYQLVQVSCDASGNYGLWGRIDQPRLFQRGNFQHGGKVYEWAYPGRPMGRADVVVKNFDRRGRADHQSQKNFQRPLAIVEMNSLAISDNPSIDEMSYVVSRCYHLKEWAVETGRLRMLNGLVAHVIETAKRGDSFTNPIRYEAALFAGPQGMGPALEYLTVGVEVLSSAGTYYLMKVGEALLNRARPDEALAIVEMMEADGGTMALGLKRECLLLKGDTRGALAAHKKGASLFPEDPMFSDEAFQRSYKALSPSRGVLLW